MLYWQIYKLMSSGLTTAAFINWHFNDFVFALQLLNLKLIH